MERPRAIAGPGVAGLPPVADLAGAELGEYRVGYIRQDGMRHRVILHHGHIRPVLSTTLTGSSMSTPLRRTTGGNEFAVTRVNVGECGNNSYLEVSTCTSTPAEKFVIFSPGRSELAGRPVRDKGVRRRAAHFRSALPPG
jgi:hypothetical protein